MGGAQSLVALTGDSILAKQIINTAFRLLIRFVRNLGLIEILTFALNEGKTTILGMFCAVYKIRLSLNYLSLSRFFKIL